MRPQALTPGDLDGTAYDSSLETASKLQQQLAKPRLHVFRWTIGLGLLCAAFVVARKAYFRIAF